MTCTRNGIDRVLFVSELLYWSEREPNKQLCRITILNVIPERIKRAQFSCPFWSLTVDLENHYKETLVERVIKLQIYHWLILITIPTILLLCCYFYSNNYRAIIWTRWLACLPRIVLERGNSDLWEENSSIKDKHKRAPPCHINSCWNRIKMPNTEDYSSLLKATPVSN